MASIFDVARLAGVSIKTVSRVMNDEPGVRDTTRQSVIAAAEKLSYRPHRGARMMRSQRSGIVGLVTGALSFHAVAPTESGLSSLHIARGVQQVCRRHGRTLMISDPGDSTEDLLSLLDTFRSYKVDGVIFAANYMQQISVPWRPDLPMVLANCCDGSGTQAFVPDDYAGQRGAVEHLIAKGHRRIGYIGLETEILAGQRRRDGFVDAMTEAGLLLEPGWVWIGSRPRREGAIFSPLEDAIAGALAAKSRPTAICFGNDVMALRAMPILEKAGIAVPDEISIIGFDNDATIAEALRPRLTTVELPYFEIGNAAAEALLARIGSGERTPPSDPVKVACRVVARESVVPPRDRNMPAS